MRLRTKLSLGFTLLAVTPAAVLGYTTLRTVSEGFERVFETQLADAERTLSSEVERASRDTSRTIDAMARTSPAIEAVARDLFLGDADLASLVPLAKGLMVGRDLQILFLLDQEGRVVSSGHLPGRFGYRELDLIDLADVAVTDLQWIEVREGDRIMRRLGLLSARPVHYGSGGQPPLFVIGGRLLGAQFVERLQDLTGSPVTLESADGDLIASAGASGEHVGLRVREVPLLARDGTTIARLRVSVSDAPLARARSRILLVLLLSGLLAVAAAVLLGGLIASRITLPVDALALGAERVAAGNYDHTVETSASGELLHLVEAFNKMTTEIRASHERIATAERIAAWQDIARRLAHEIKNPLTPISTSIETLRRTWSRKHPQFEEIFEESTQAILEEVAALRRIVDEFSRFARLPAPNPQPISPAELVDGTLSLFPEPPEGIELSRSVAPDLPNVSADREQLQQVLLNLVTNSIQAIQSGPGRGRVTVRSRAVDGEVLLEVSDDGPGIPSEHLDEVFTPYFTTKEGGTGLGLAICHRIVDEHGGRITVSSSPGGTTFRITLPAS